MLKKIPNGLDEICAVFGLLDDPDFESKNIVSFQLPYPMKYGEVPVTHSRCHRLAVDHFVAALQEVKGLADRNVIHQPDVQEYGGIYNQRSIRGMPSHASTHSWGIAIDLDPERFPLGSKSRLPQPIIDAFKKFGFTYGGDFISRKDPMHFQLCTGY